MSKDIDDISIYINCLIEILSDVSMHLTVSKLAMDLFFAGCFTCDLEVSFW